MAATLGVGTWHYAPYALFSFMSPLVVIALAFLNIRMGKALLPLAWRYVSKRMPLEEEAAWRQAERRGVGGRVVERQEKAEGSSAREFHVSDHCAGSRNLSLKYVIIRILYV